MSDDRVVHLGWPIGKRYALTWSLCHKVVVEKDHITEDIERATCIWCLSQARHRVEQDLLR